MEDPQQGRTRRRTKREKGPVQCGIAPAAVTGTTDCGRPLSTHFDARTLTAPTRNFHGRRRRTAPITAGASASGIALQTETPRTEPPTERPPGKGDRCGRHKAQREGFLPIHTPSVARAGKMTNFPRCGPCLGLSARPVGSRPNHLVGQKFSCTTMSEFPELSA